MAGFPVISISLSGGGSSKLTESSNFGTASSSFFSSNFDCFGSSTASIFVKGDGSGV